MSTETDSNKTIATANICIVIIMFITLCMQSDANRRFLKQASDEQQQAIALWREDIEFRKKMDLTNKAPYLIIQQCCNSRLVSFVEYDNRISLQLAKEQGEGVTPGSSIYPYVAKIVNVGGGPALECRINWEFEAYDQDEYQPVSDTPGAYTWPKVAYPGNEVEIRHLPYEVQKDKSLSTELKNGAVELTCIDLSGKKHTFRHPFTLRMYYAEPTAKAGTFSPDAEHYASFHFYDTEASGGPYPHKHLDGFLAF